MTTRQLRARLTGLVFASSALVALLLVRDEQPTSAQEPKADAKPADYATAVQPLVKKYCLNCHSTKAKKGSLDLERFATLADVRKDVKVWQGIIEQIEAGEMPPKEQPQPTDDREEGAARLDSRVPRRGGEGPHRRSGARPAAAPEQRRVRLHRPRPDRRRSATDARVPRRRRRRRGLHQRRRSADGHLARPVHQVPERGQGHRRPRGAAARRLPLLAVEDAPRLDRRGHRRAAEVLRHPRAGRRKTVTSAYLLATVRHRDALAAGKFDGGRGEGKAEREVPRACCGKRSPTRPRRNRSTRSARGGAPRPRQDVPALAAEVTARQTALWRTVRVGSYVQARWGEAREPAHRSTA